MTSTAVRTTTLPSGDSLPVLGLGTWHMAEDRRRRGDELRALPLGLDLGLELKLTEEDLGELEAAFPPPTAPQSLEML